MKGLLLGPGGEEEQPHAAPWYKVMWLSGVDYFSTLGYQPSIAFLAAQVLSPVATVLLVAVTLAGALPVYLEVAKSSWAGKGSIAMLERLVPGWAGKLFVLSLLGFATTDFVITMTLSAADAAKHAVENPVLAPMLGGLQLPLTLLLLGLLAAVFLAGFREAIGIAVKVAVPYVVLNGVVIVAALLEAFWHPELREAWSTAVAAQGSWPVLLGASALVFPKLALGMSGFETGVSVMPQIDPGSVAVPAPIALPQGEPPLHPPSRAGKPVLRIEATKKLLAASAVLMSGLLIASSWVTTVLIPAAEFEEGGHANGRALSFLAHELLGHVFGSVYDFFTIAILWFAGASAMAGLMNLIPRYLPRFGMAPWWVERPRPLVLAFFLVNVLVTLVFKADVDAQGGAYATGVLVVMLSAAVAVTIHLWKTERGKARYFAAVSAVFVYVLLGNVVQRPDGVIISAAFIVAMLTLGGLSRWWRATELRLGSLGFAEAESERLFRAFEGKKINLVPLGHGDREGRRAKGDELRRYYKIEGPIVFLHVELADDRSEFESRLKVRITPLGAEQYEMDVTGAVAIANTIAALSEKLDPKTLFLGLTRAQPMSAALKYLLWGEGEVGLLVYQILVRYWRETPEDDVRPLIFLLSE